MPAWCVVVPVDGEYWDDGIESVYGPFGSQIEADKFAAGMGARKDWEVMEMKAPEVGAGN